ncbi:Protein STRUBBELIG-RECEPTOR FAMILY 8 [Camellia lanceoleosa]|uniref:Protein STRUBBELIG-RECEPTOR FAMILY 8 n=1 Tax=Camellia lanceoleosa TaxID=1840588 RepID=A0ACC0F7Y8_9ERIC|nr:Protein STRUBBELIG-RECEPTOR FAMILY 8 [Camellia lanceoleosa]
MGLFLVLYWSLGVFGTDCVRTVVVVTVRHRRLRLGTVNRGVDGLEKKPNLEPSLGPEPEFRPPMSEVVQALIRSMQRASVVKRRSSDEISFYVQDSRS